MIVYVDLERDKSRCDSNRWEQFAASILEAKYRLEEISGDHCLIVHYDHVTSELLDELSTQAVIVGGHYTVLQNYDRKDLAGLEAILRDVTRPTIAFCGGFQLMAELHGANMVPIDPSNPCPETPSPPGPDADILVQDLMQERGFLPVHVLDPQPLFTGLAPHPIVYQLHSWTLDAPPGGFRVLAMSDLCDVQSIAHEEMPLLGTQFHPELYDDTHQDGRKILENFFKFAARWSDQSSSEVAG